MVGECIVVGNSIVIDNSLEDIPHGSKLVLGKVVKLDLFIDSVAIACIVCPYCFQVHGYHGVLNRCLDPIVSRLGGHHVQRGLYGLHIINELVIALFAGHKVFKDAVEQGIEQIYHILLLSAHFSKYLY